MTRETAKKHLEAFTAFANGAIIWAYDLESDDRRWFRVGQPSFSEGRLYIVEDEHFEARKAYALGKPIQCRYKGGMWEWRDVITTPAWASDAEYRERPEWEPTKGEWCFFYDDPNGEYFGVVQYAKQHEGLFIDAGGGEWRHCAELPVEVKALFKNLKKDS